MSSPAHRRRRLARGLLFAFALSAAGAAAVSAGTPGPSPALEPQALVRAKAIQAHVNARYRRLPGRKLRVTEATTLEGIESISIIEDAFEPSRVVPAGNGIYYQLRPVRARCPCPARSAAWSAEAFRPRRLALELAVRTFSRTTAALVVVALPLPPRFHTWIVFQRDDFSAEVGAPLREQLMADPGYADAELRTVVDRLTRRRTIAVIEIVPAASGRATVSAIAIFWP